MITRRRIVIWPMALLVILGGIYLAEASMEITPAENALVPPCSDCHLCGRPTEAEPCLKECLSAHHGFDPADYKGPEPGLIQLGQPGGMYEPVAFDHQRHAEMGSMADGCVACHHLSPQGRIPPCTECHLEPQSLGQPGLKGVYHRQCLGCHKAWSGSTECVECHLDDQSGRSSSTVPPGQTGTTQMAISRPGKKVYSTPVKQGTKVTFYHSDHTDLFGLHCSDCHHNEGCGNCHRAPDTQTAAKSAEEIHAICNDCHDGDNCKLCHGKQEKPSFTHDVSHWRLGEYHRHLPCRSCHEVGQRITALKANCVQCHDNWEPSNFNHRVTGLALDETHAEFECDVCHSERNYHQSPTCVECHDETLSPGVTPPGMMVNAMNSEQSAPVTKEEVH